MNGRRDPEVRRVLIAILGLNVMVAVAKLGYGYVSGSVSISADGVHSFADGLSNVVALIALKVAAMPPDENHPYGHRKFEVLGSLAIGIMILLGMLGIAQRTFWGEPGELHIGVGGYAIVLTTLLVNIGVATYEARAARRLGSSLLEADSKHTASDVLATLAVLLAFVTERFGWRGADRAAAIFIMVLIGAVSWQIFRGAIDALVDAAPLDKGPIKREVRSVRGVVDCHKVRSRGTPGEVLMDLHIQVEPSITVREGHEIAHKVQHALRRRFPEIIEVIVHTEPASAEQLRAFSDRREVTVE